MSRENAYLERILDPFFSIQLSKYCDVLCRNADISETSDMSRENAK